MSRRIDHEKRARMDRAKRAEIAYQRLAAAPDSCREGEIEPQPSKKKVTKKTIARARRNIAKSVYTVGEGGERWFRNLRHGYKVDFG